MPDNSTTGVEGSELSPRDEPYNLESLRVPQSIDGEPHEALDEALAEFVLVLADLAAYGARLEKLTFTTMLSEATTLPDIGKDGAAIAAYPDRTYELQAVRRAVRAVQIAENLIDQARTELAKPIADSRRLGVS